MRLPRGSASTMLTLAAGGMAAAAVGATGFPMVRDAAQRESHALGSRLALVAELARPEGPMDDADLEALVSLDGVNHAVFVHPSGASLGTMSNPEVWMRAAACIPPDEGVQLTKLFAAPDGTQARAACSHNAAAGTLLVTAGADYREGVAIARKRAITLVLGLGSLVGLVVIAGMRWLLSPMAEVSDAASRIADGELEVRVEPRGPEEIADLARAVNALAAAIDHREDEIESRIQVVTQLSSLVAHEVRNPLHSLALLCELARSEPDSKRRGSILSKIEAEIHALEAVVQRFLRNSGPLQISLQDVDAIELLQRAADMARPKAKAKAVRLLLQAPGRLPAHIDGSLIRRSVENLLLNAIEFASLEPPGQVTVAMLSRGKNLLIIVDDDGPGVPPEARQRIFQPYHSTKSGGTGLGLALVQRVVTAHGGTVRCEKSPLGGARFVVIVPRHPPPDSEVT